jgi:hypothetical protein
VAEHDQGLGARAACGASARRRHAAKRVGPIGERALEVLTQAMESPSVPWSCRITAAGMLADRAFGRAPQSVNLDMTKKLNELSRAAPA